MLLVAEPSNINYLTGYDCWTMVQPQALLVPYSGDVVFFAREVDLPGVTLTTHLRSEQVFGYPEDYVEKADRHPFDWIAGVMRERGLMSGTLAIERDSNFYTIRSHEALMAGLPNVNAVDSQRLVNWVRAVKSDSEIDKMRIAGRIVERVMGKTFDMIEPGVRQCDVAAQIYANSIMGLENAGGTYPSAPPLMPTGPGTAVPHLTWSDAPFKSGESTSLEFAGCYHRYNVPLARAIFLGAPPPRLLEMADIVNDGMDVALAAIRPGARCEDVEAAWRVLITRYGLSKATRIGYSIGVGYPVTSWLEKTMSLRPGDTTVLEPNMTFHVLLGMWMDGWGYALSESVVVTERGAECLSNVPRGLRVKR
ncbi:Xaa-Pro peptidase family protein [Mesorhizobium sp. M0571]